MKIKTSLQTKMTVPVYSVSEYFSLPISERTWMGLYKLPAGLPAEFSAQEQGWSFFSKQIRKQHPIQWFFREWIMSHSNPVYNFIKKFQ